MTLIVILLVFFSIVIHEMSHALAAYILGDQTAKRMGRLSLNPLKHVDPFGTIILPFTLLAISRFTGAHVPLIGYAKPVPIDPSGARFPRLFEAVVGIAGPFSNFVLAFVGTVIIIKLKLLHTEFGEPLQILIRLNLLLGIFNLIPIPPLDGSRILAAFLPETIAQVFDRMGIAGFFLIMMFIQTRLFERILDSGSELFLSAVIDLLK